MNIDLDNARAVTEAPDGAGGNNNSPDYLITIAINSNSNEHGADYRPNLMIVKTIAHELIHAEIFRKMLSAVQSGNLNTSSMSTQEAEKIQLTNSLNMYYHSTTKNCPN